MKRRRFRSVIIMMLVCILVVGLVVPGAAFAASKKQLKIGLSVPSLSFAWFIFLQDAVKQRAAELGNIELIVVDAQNNPAKQFSDIEDLIVKGIDGMLLVPIDVQALIPAVEALNESKIPVVTVDRMVEGGDVLAHVGADNVEGGRLAGRYVAWLLGGKGKVVELEGTPGSSPARDRGRGFNEVIANYPEIEVVARQTAQFRRADGLQVMENILQAHPDVDAVFAHNDEMIMGALEALKGQGKDDEVLTVGFDAIKDALESVEAGVLDATVEQFPGKQAQQGLDILVDYLRNGVKPKDKEIYITPAIITKGNIGQAEKRF